MSPTTFFEWLDFKDAENSIISFMRKDKTGRKILLFVCNFTPVPRWNYRIGIPYDGFYQEVLNSDAARYYGSNVGNAGGVMAEPNPLHGRTHSVNIRIPPLGVLIFKIEAPEPVVIETEEEGEEKAGEKAGEKTLPGEGKKKK